MSGGARIGVVLSSGGIRGVYAHTGFLLALEQLGLPIAAMVGCSAGAVVGGIAASGADLGAWSRALARVQRAEFWTPDPLWRFIWRIAARRGRGYTGLSGTEAAGAFCRRHLAATRIEDCRYPFHTLAVNLASGAKTMFSDGELVPRILASAAMPVLYRPVAIDGELYCDGALLDLAPMDAICCRHRLDALIIHHVAARHAGTPELVRRLQEPWSLFAILERLLYRQRPWYLSEAPLGFHRCPCGCGAAVVVPRAASAGAALAPDRRRTGDRDRRAHAGAGAAAAAPRGAVERSAHTAAAAGGRSPARKNELRADVTCGYSGC